MKAGDFTKKWIRLNEEAQHDLDNDYNTPVMVINHENGLLFTIKDLRLERAEGGGYTLWIEVEEW